MAFTAGNVQENTVVQERLSKHWHAGDLPNKLCLKRRRTQAPMRS